MDSPSLATQLVVLLMQLLPYLRAASGALAEELPEAAGKIGQGVLEEIGKDGWGAAKTLYKKLRAWVSSEPRAEEALTDLAAAPTDPDAQGALRIALRKLLERDAGLAGEIEALLALARPNLPQLAVIQGSPGAIVHQGDGPIYVVNQTFVVQIVDRIEEGGASRGAGAPFLPGLPAQPKADYLAATREYLNQLITLHQFLSFRGMGVTPRVALRLPLLELYVPSQARLQAAERLGRGDRDRAGLLRAAGAEGLAGMEESEQAGGRVPLLDLLRAHDGLVVLGEPGAGKTSFLKVLALSLAVEPGAGHDFDLGLGARLPLLVSLAEYGDALRKEDLSLERFVALRCAEKHPGLPFAELLRDALGAGGVLALFDGLDEVRDRATRLLVVRKVEEFFAASRGRGNKCVLTSRIQGYAEVRPSAVGLAECTIELLDDDEIAAFVDRWTRAIEQLAGAGAQAAVAAAAEREGLLAAIRSNQGLRRLAANPMLLTILALMKRQNVVLPERRAELYQTYVDTLLWHWNQARSLGGKPLADAEPDDGRTLKVLAPLALRLHEEAPGGIASEALVRTTLREIFHDLHEEDPAAAAETFLERVRAQDSLLLDLGGERFRFVHLTFQEYLAAVGLAQKGQQDVAPMVAALAPRLVDPNWREVALLAVGYLALVQHRDQAAGDLLTRLIERVPGAEALVFAGRALLDVGPTGVPAEVRSRVVQALNVARSDDVRVSSRLRVEAAEALADLGDPRRGLLDVDEMEFCWVPPGRFRMGGAKSDRKAWDDGNPIHTVEIPSGYWLGRYPVTIAQFAEYVRETDRPPEEPAALRGPATRPVVSVSWFEAAAFCAWLAERWRDRLPGGYTAQLPSEAEWEMATRGGLQIPMPVPPPVRRVFAEPESALAPNPDPERRYPWGKAAEANRMNFEETKLGRPSPPGCFPGGASPLGCEELSGNVWEWTQSVWGDYPFPEPGKPRLKRELGSEASLRVLRGGAFDLAPRNVRCAVRLWDAPDVRFDLIGFRVVVSPFRSEL